ncbi:uncharacterized protein [Pagrus major]|uniref:uncharacterized protein n=1 Tax=Pagrus major TaxID=143350 RepID=UPI003CC856D7
MVNLKVTDAESSSPKTTPKTIIIRSTPSFAVTNSSTVSSDGSDVVTDMSVSYTIHSTTTTTSATQGAGSVPYLITGVTVILTILMVLLMLMRKMRKKHLTVEEDTQEDVEYDEIRPEHHQTVSRPAGVSPLYYSVDAESLYANCSYHQDIELAAESGDNSQIEDRQCDLVYSVAQLPKEQIEPTGQSESNQSNENDSICLYTLAQLPQAS